ncbi:MAG: DUF1501 domain-containing protein [Planctomycetota bacterium]|nr:DUF1501 domain-containing protein [Planctomycetota bacterium]
MNRQRLLNRRTFLSNAGTGLSGMALAHLLDSDGLLAASPIRPEIHPGHPHAPRPAHSTPLAKQVLMIFCAGAISHVDTFDYKPALLKRHNQPMPGSKDLVTFQGAQGNLIRPLWDFRPRGKSGKMVSDLVGHIGDFADEICFVHSMKGKTNTHGPGENFMSTGFTLEGFPSMGSWVTYALGSENEELPAYVAISDPRGKPQSSVNNWGPGFLPAAFQGTDFNANIPVRNLARHAKVSPETDAATRAFLHRLNKRHLERYPGESELAARISSYELAAKMQLSIPEVSDLSSEPSHILRMYGANDSPKLKAEFARNCILGRRLIEEGVRFVQVFNGAYQTGGEGTSNWDGHKKIKPQYDVHGPILNQPTGALLQDMKQRGLLEDTLVVFCTEFGRMPTFQKGASGRDHNPDGFTCWLAGAGVKKGYSYGATDEFGYRAVENVCTVYDFHATILHLLGLDHQRLSYYHNGLERRLTDVHGHVIQDLLA